MGRCAAALDEAPKDSCLDARVSLSSKTGTTSASRRLFQLSAQFSHGLGALGFTDDHTMTARQVLLRRHLEELRIPFVELALLEPAR
jgi:hypothetical protein